MAARSMSVKVVILQIALYFCLTQFTKGSKYSAASNSVNDAVEDESFVPLEDEKTPFRMQKVNLLWNKAKKRISGPKLAELYADLKVQDNDEAMLKKLKNANKDEDGTKEAQVLASYRRIFEHYDLGDFIEPKLVNMNNDIPRATEWEGRSEFRDPKLQSMWQRALKSGFSESDLKMLREEFFHQQMKIDEYNMLHRKTLDIGGDQDQDVNSIHTDYSKLNLRPMEAMEKKQSMKKHNGKIREGYMKLEELAKSLPNTEPVFSDSRVDKLWAMAKKTNWSEEELIGFQEELKHFDHRLHKQAFYKEQFERTAEGEAHPSKLNELKEKSDSLNHRVKKLHVHLKNRVDKALQHSEL